MRVASLQLATLSIVISVGWAGVVIVTVTVSIRLLRVLLQVASTKRNLKTSPVCIKSEATISVSFQGS